MDADGSNKKQLTEHGHSPKFSPDDSRIIFTSSKTGNADIYIVDANGKNERNLTNHPSTDAGPVFPNGF